MPQTVLMHGVIAGMHWVRTIVIKRQELYGGFTFMKNEDILFA